MVSILVGHIFPRQPIKRTTRCRFARSFPFKPTLWTGLANLGNNFVLKDTYIRQQFVLSPNEHHHAAADSTRQIEKYRNPPKVCYATRHVRLVRRYRLRPRHNHPSFLRFPWNQYRPCYRRPCPAWPDHRRPESYLSEPHLAGEQHQC